ncbi:MAG: DUF1624 domain-containing protein [Spirochaetales bacterium]|nr:DUF1624 domain-containing protein [Spirochaetales bacterium]
MTQSATIDIKKNRDYSIDYARGLFIVLMALDHASYFVGKYHINEFWTGIASPITGIQLFIRVLTHICAPGFFFLAGLSVVLFAESRKARGWNNNQISLHFLKRGLLLLVLQVVIEDVAWFLGALSDQSEFLAGVPGGGSDILMHFGVLSALGFAMIICGLIYRLDYRINILLAFLCLVATNLFVSFLGEPDRLVNPLLRLLFLPGHTNSIQVFYPIAPWLACSLFGVAAARLYLRDRKRFGLVMAISGVVLLILFIILRLTTSFGSYLPFDAEKGAMSFFLMSKYPPSPIFLLFTFGINNLIIAFFIFAIRKECSRFCVLTLFGSEPLFFYCLHLVLYLLLGIPFFHGASEWVIFLMWILGLGIMYPIVLLYKSRLKKLSLKSLLKKN